MTLAQLSAEIDLILKPLDFQVVGHRVSVYFWNLKPNEQDVYSFFLSANEVIPLPEYRRYLAFRKGPYNGIIFDKNPEELKAKIREAVNAACIRCGIKQPENEIEML